MKKLSILLIGLLLVTGFAFAQDVTVKGDATITFGVDLNNMATGFSNAASSSISLAWMSGDESKGTQGWINLTGWKISYASDDAVTVGAPTVSAGWMFDPVTITIYSAPTFSGTNAASFVFADEDDPDDVATVELSAANTGDPAGEYSTTGTWYLFDVANGDRDDIPDNAVLIDSDPYGDGSAELYWVADTIPSNTSTPGFQGITATIDLGVASVDLMLASDGTWAENAVNAYATGLKVTADVGPATVNAGVFYGPFAVPGDLGATGGVSAVVGPLTIGLGADYWAPDEAWDARADVSAAVAGISVASTTYVADATPMQIDEQVVVDASGVVEGLGLTNTFQMVDIMQFYSIYNETALSYDTMMGVKPFTTVGYEYVTASGADPATTISLEAGVELTGFVENTVFTIKYASDDLSTDGDKGLVTVAGKISF